MKLRLLTLVLTIVLAFSGVMSLLGASAQGAPGGGAGSVKVRVASNLKEKDAAQLQRYLQADGYGSGAPIEVAVDAAGNYSVLIGPLESEAQAQALVKDLQESGYQPEGVVAVEAVGEKVVSRAEAGRVFRVQVGEFAERRQAEGLQQTLLNDDYAGVDILEEGGMFKVVIGAFPTERDSQKLLEQLRNDGYSFAKVIETGETATGQKATAIAEREITLPAEAQALSPEEQEKAKELIRMRERASAGIATADEIVQLREDLKKLRSEVANVVKLVTTNEQANREKLKKVRPIQEKFNNAILNKNIQAAEAALEELKALDPNEPSLAFYIAQLNTLRAGGAAQGQKSDDQKRINQLLNEAKAAFAAKRYDDARFALASLRGIDPGNAEAQKLLREINDAAQKAAAPPAVATSTGLGKQLLVVYAAGGVLALVVVALAGYVFVTSRREQRLLAEMQGLGAAREAGGVSSPSAPPATPAAATQSGAKPSRPTPEPKLASAPSLGGMPSALSGAGALGSTILGKVAAAEAPPETEAPPKAAPEIFRPETEVIQEQRPAGEADVLVLNDIAGSTTEKTEPSAPEPMSSEIKLPEIEIPMPGLEETQTAGPASQEGPSPLDLDALAGVDIDALIGGAKDTTPEVGAARGGPEPVIPSISLNDEPTVTPSEQSGGEASAAPASAEVSEGPAPERPPVAEAMAAGALDATAKLPAVEPTPTASASAAKKIIFEQTFDDEEPGTQPRGWQGEYEYASLVVDSTSPAPGSRACLKFEKRTGAGSAHYVCHFPKATGLVVVEFDIRCDEKNKYLLGFYIEKDEDFKQSVHTIIHRLDSRSQPTLRVQGEPVPYDLGTWRHVKYVLNLLAGLATAYVDDKEIVRDAKLASNYGYVNTLSIRDNLATTGVLYLDNIKIYQG